LTTVGRLLLPLIGEGTAASGTSNSDSINPEKPAPSSEVVEQQRCLEILKQPVKVNLTKKRREEERIREEAFQLFEKVLEEGTNRWRAYWDRARQRHR
jgi:hypothetical protein